MSPIAAFSQLPAIFVAGSAFAVLYARSDNLMLCVGIHALANKPTLLVTDRFGLLDNLVFATVMCLILAAFWGTKRVRRCAAQEVGRLQIPTDTNHGITRTATKLRISDCAANCVWLTVP